MRHEIKTRVTAAEARALRVRLQAVMQRDKHALQDGTYEIHSVYFDTPTNRALMEKQVGMPQRDKYRIRYYNGDTSLIRLEKKSKINGLCSKQSEPLTKEEAQKIVNGDTAWMATSGRPLLIELYSKMKSQLLRPKTIVDYTRIPFVYAPGNVRVTIDYNIRTGLSCTDFLNPDCITIPAGEPVILLEVKWDEYLPGIIRRAVQVKNRRAGAFSKYQICRIYG